MERQIQGSLYYCGFHCYEYTILNYTTQGGDEGGGGDGGREKDETKNEVREVR